MRRVSPNCVHRIVSPEGHAGWQGPHTSRRHLLRTLAVCPRARTFLSEQGSCSRVVECRAVGIRGSRSARASGRPRRPAFWPLRRPLRKLSYHEEWVRDTAWRNAPSRTGIERSRRTTLWGSSIKMKRYYKEGEGLLKTTVRLECANAVQSIDCFAILITLRHE